MNPLRLSLVSMQSVVGDERGNLDKMLGFIGTARVQMTDVICFPEMCLSGYTTDSSRMNPIGRDDPLIRELMDSTANIPMTICFGFCETGPYITQMLIREGKEIGCYRKTHLGSREKASYLAGDSLDVFRTEDAVIAMQLCWECHVPRETETYVRRGAELILMPHASGLGPGRRREVWDTILPARAYDNTVFIGACNAYGENGCGVRFGGGITARDPKGKLIDEDYGREHMLTVDLDPEDMERIRSGSPSTMADLFFMDGYRPDLYD